MINKTGSIIQDIALIPFPNMIDYTKSNIESIVNVFLEKLKPFILKGNCLMLDITAKDRDNFVIQYNYTKLYDYTENVNAVKWILNEKIKILLMRLFVKGDRLNEIKICNITEVKYEK